MKGKKPLSLVAILVLFCLPSLHPGDLEDTKSNGLWKSSSMSESTKSGVSFGFPDGDFQFYHMACTFQKQELKPFTLTKVTINGEEVRDFSISGIDDQTVLLRGNQRRYPQYNRKVLAGKDLSVKVRCAWQPGKSYSLVLSGKDEKGKTVIRKIRGTPARRFGYWNPAWKYYATLIVREIAGFRRTQEPVHLKLALYTDRLTEPRREIRVVEFDPDRLDHPDGPYREVPSQVYNVSTWNDEKLIRKIEVDEKSKERIVRYLPTTTLEIAFFADVDSRGEKVYLMFYGNPGAPAPAYQTDLKVSSPEIGQTLENDMMRVKLDDKSGVIYNVFLKQGKDVLLEHKLETNGAVHWNPDAYSPPHAWVHTSDWDKPNFEQVTGPIFHMTKRWAPLPHMDNTLVNTTYIFYAGKPYMISSSLTEILQDFNGKAIRNGEVVFNHEKLNEFVYQTLSGEIDEVKLENYPRHPEHAFDIPYDVPWVAFINPSTRIGFAAINLEVTSTNRYGGMSDAEQPYYYVNNGPWIYFSRALNYTGGSNNASRMIRFAKGSMYYERTAFMPFVLGESQADRYQSVREQDILLRHPLRVTYHLDTDNRNNPAWLVPILTEPFDEGVSGAVGGKKE
jgi:hypothetical protein